MTRFCITATRLDGVHLIERQPRGDRRGALTRLFCAEDLAAAGWRKPIVQINQTQTIADGTLRGLHFQKAPGAEMKLVMCLQGSVFDVAVDLRRGSPTFLCHTHAVLSAENNQALLIPEGCAHGFQTLTDDVVLLYLHSAAYDATVEGGVSAIDERLAIDWPKPIAEMSDRDRNHPPLSPAFQGLVL